MKTLGCGGIILVLALFVANFCAWLTHVVHCLHTSEWGFLIAGALVAPIGIIHGWGLWFGFFV